MNLRLSLIFVFFLLFGAAVIGRLFYLQVERGDFYKALARGQRGAFEERVGQRGGIFSQDKDGKLFPLAVNTRVQDAFASPVEISDVEETARIVSEIFDIPREQILQKLSRQESLYEIIKRRLSDEELAALSDQNLQGIHLQNRVIRYFPHGDFAAHVTGFVDAQGSGRYGVEGNYDEILRGKQGLASRVRGLLGGLISADFFQERLQEGTDVVLTIDQNVQFFAEKLLVEAVRDLVAKEGTVIVMDPRTGKIIALANEPSFDPNQYFEEQDLDIFRNSAHQKLYEPGSVFKPFVMAAALEEGKITPQTTYIDEGIVQIGGYPIYNYDNRVWGEQTMTEVLEKSINTGAVFAERQLGNDLFLQYIDAFGFLDPTGIDLQGEEFSGNHNLQKGREINFATASFGQGIEMTPIQLIRSFASLVNGGKLVTPHIVEKTMMPDGTVREFQPESGKQVIFPETSAKLSAMLVRVVEEGYGKGAAIPGYSVGGKTGTAQVSWAALGVSKSGYSDETVQTFVGFVPAFAPRFIILVKLNNPRAKTAEYSAVPVFRNLAKYIVDYWEIPTEI